MTMTLDKATSFLRMLQNGQIDRRPICEWIGLREACGVILAHLAQPAQSVDIEAIREVIEDMECSSLSAEWTQPDRWAERLAAALQEKGNG